MFKYLWFFVILFHVSLANATVIFSEILADPPAGAAGDANADGTPSSTQDEFVEFFNNSVSSIDISNWFLTDATAMRHVFPSGSIIPAYDYLVVFGGGSFSPTALKQKASTGGLSLNNTGDTVKIFDATGLLVEELTYTSLANQDQSIVRATPTSQFVLHSSLPENQGKVYSPGNGYLGNAVATPEPATLALFGLGVLGFSSYRKRIRSS